MRKEVYVSVYEVSRHYGGPEEGGWWYDWLQFTGQSFITRERNAGYKAARVQESLESDQPRYDRFSCANCGEGDLVVMIEDRQGEYQSHGRPRYE